MSRNWMSQAVLLLACLTLWLFLCYNLHQHSNVEGPQRQLASVQSKTVNVKASGDGGLSLFKTYQTEVLDSLVGSVLLHNGVHYKLLANDGDHEYRNKYFLWEMSLNNTVHKYSLEQNNVIDISHLNINLFDKKNRQVLREDPSDSLIHPLTPQKEMLIILTTCNQLKMTIFALEYLKATHSAADFLIVDDHSIDGTVDYLIKKGYAVITKAKARGLTDSWNKGYELAVAMGYKYLIFTNNDVLVSLSGIKLMQRELKEEVLVVPLTSTKGAGHNPSQSLVRAYRLRESMNDYVDNYRHFELIQNSLDKISVNTSAHQNPWKKDSPFQRLIPSIHRGIYRFNGFFFGINLKNIAPAAISHPRLLFDAEDLMVGQEDHLMERMKELNMVPKIALCVFIYHFKSVTVSSAMKSLSSLKKYDPKRNYSRGNGRKFNVRLDVDIGNGTKESKTMDIRDDLRFYHPEFKGKKKAGVPVAGAVGGVVGSVIPAPKPKRLLSESNSTTAGSNSSISTTAAASAAAAAASSSFRSILSSITSSSSPPKVLLMPASPSSPSSLSDSLSFRLPHSYPDMSSLLTYPELYYSYPSLMTDTSASVVPSFTDMLVSLNRSKIVLRGKATEVARVQLEMDHLKRSIEFKTRVIVGFAISDPARNPAAGDIFTAQELGDVLERDYNVEVRYLRRGVQWYSPRHLCDLDILITMLDAFDLGKALAVLRAVKETPYNSISGYDRFSMKSSLISIAWMRNWFQRWLTQPWIGNYDILLASSHTSKSFFEQIGSSVGFPVQCVMGCPNTQYPQWQKSVDFEMPSGSRNNLLSRRVSVPVELLPLATNQWFFYPANGTTALLPSKPKSVKGKQRKTPPLTSTSSSVVSKFKADYVFTGSYYKVHRKIMDFDPAVLPKWKGLIVGEGWDQANVSAAWKKACIGMVPYEQIPAVYRSVKIVIDDANHVTMPWGSVNSRVFDALSAGALVVTNGKAGFESTFGRALSNLSMPLFYSSGKELAKVLDYYLKNTKQRLQVVESLRKIVLATHTYTARARQLSRIVGQYGVTLMASENNRILMRKQSGGGGAATAAAASGGGSSGKKRRRRRPKPDKGSKEKSGKKPAKGKRMLLEEQTQPQQQLLEALEGQEGEEGTEVTRDFSISAVVGEEEADAGSAYRRSLWSTPNDDIVQISAELEKRNPPNDTSICVGIRTIEAQSGWLEILVRTLVQQYVKSPYRNQVDLKIFITNTDQDSSRFQSTLAQMVTKVSIEYGIKIVFVVSDSRAYDRQHRNAFYGYDSTDFLVAHMISLYTQTLQEKLFMSAHHHAYYSSHFLSTNKNPCEWLLLTNGDNLYNSAWFNTIAPLVLSRKVDAIAWDYVTHHLRGDNLDKTEQVTSVALKRKFVDLGSLMARTKLYIESKVTFVDDTVFTKDLYARDYFTFASLMKYSTPQRLQLVHNCLLFHQ